MKPDPNFFLPPCLRATLLPLSDERVVCHGTGQDGVSTVEKLQEQESVNLRGLLAPKCPVCGGKFKPRVPKCPKCGVALEWSKQAIKF